jgi:hypothetical protein
MLAQRTPDGCGFNSLFATVSEKRFILSKYFNIRPIEISPERWNAFFVNRVEYDDPEKR